MSQSTSATHYYALKEKWLTEENSSRQDYAFRSSLSTVARQAVEIVDQIRKDEIDHYWRHAGLLGQEDSETFAGMMFPLARPLISCTKLWKIVQRMPKGALLHTHWNAMLPYETVFKILQNTEGMVISSSQSLSLDIDRQNATLAIGHVNHSLDDSSPSLQSERYVAGTPISLKKAAAEWDGGETAFYEFLKIKVSLTPDLSIHHELGVDSIWRQFSKYFSTGGTMLLYEPVFRAFVQTLLEGLVDDGVRWVELRSDTSLANVVPQGQETPSPDPNFPWAVLADEVKRFQASEKGRGFWGLRVIWSDRRVKNKTLILEGMESCIAQKQQFPELFSGYDLVGQEDLGHSLSYFAPELLWFREKANSLNLTIPFFFHAGETLGTGNGTDLNLFDAMMLPDTRRIGHGFSLYKHPSLMQYAKEQDILVEVCPISNEVLRLSTDVLHHPSPALIAHGVPTSINNDDPAIMGQDEPGLSFDFYQMLQGFESLGLGGLGALAQNSIRWANFEDQTPDEWLRDIRAGESGSGIKARRIREWNAEWEAFCAWVVQEFGV